MEEATASVTLPVVPNRLTLTTFDFEHFELGWPTMHLGH